MGSKDLKEKNLVNTKKITDYILTGDILKRIAEEKSYIRKSLDQKNKDIIKSKNVVQNLHWRISEFSMEMANKIYDKWATRETEDGIARKEMANIVLKKLAKQTFIVNAVVIAVIFSPIEIHNSIVVTYMGAFLIQLIGLVTIMAKYFYNERSVESLEILSKIVIATSDNINKIQIHDSSKNLENISEPDNKEESGYITASK